MVERAGRPLGQYDPIITQDNAVLGVPEGKDGKTYYFPDDLTDQAVVDADALDASGLGGRLDHAEQVAGIHRCA